MVYSFSSLLQVDYTKTCTTVHRHIDKAKRTAKNLTYKQKESESNTNRKESMNKTAQNKSIACLIWCCFNMCE